MFRALFGSPVAGYRRNLANDKTLNIRTTRFAVGGIRAVVSDLRIGQYDNLASVGRIGEDFLVTRNRRVEYHFSSTLFRRPYADSLEDRSVLQGENCCFQLNPFPVLPILNAGNAFVQQPHG